MAQAPDQEEIIEKKPSHPVTSALLIVSSVSMLVAVYLTGTELGFYLNEKTAPMIKSDKTAVQVFYSEFPVKAGEKSRNPERQ